MGLCLVPLVVAWVGPFQRVVHAQPAHWAQAATSHLAKAQRVLMALAQALPVRLRAA
jgi:hypothetical protein